MDPIVCLVMCTNIQLVLWLQLFSCAYVNEMTTFTLPQRLNFISFLHNIGCIAFGLLYWWTMSSSFIAAMGVWSATYFMTDSMNYPDGTLMRFHHYASIGMELLLYPFYYNPMLIDGKAIFWGLFWCELSNIPLYVVYHHLRASPPRAPHKIVFVWELIQFVLCRTLCAIQFLFLTPVTLPWLYYTILGFWGASMYWARSILEKI